MRWPWKKKVLSHGIDPYSPAFREREPYLIIIAINIQEAVFYWRREHPEFHERRTIIITGAKGVSRGFHFQKDDVVMAVGRYHEIPNLQEVWDSLYQCYVGEWPHEELHLR